MFKPVQRNILVIILPTFVYHAIILATNAVETLQANVLSVNCLSIYNKEVVMMRKNIALKNVICTTLIIHTKEIQSPQLACLATVPAILAKIAIVVIHVYHAKNNYFYSTIITTLSFQDNALTTPLANYNLGAISLIIRFLNILGSARNV